MKQFFGAFFGSIVGIIVATLLALLIGTLIVKSAFKGLREKETGGIVKENTVLRLTVEGELIDRERENPFREIAGAAPFMNRDAMGLNTLVRKLDAASKDDKVKGLYLAFRNMKAGFASLLELREALKKFRAKGKFIYSYADDFSQKEYFLASVSDKIFLNPEGFFEWKGLHMNLVFLKGTIDKLGVEMQIFRHGRYKSAVEPFMNDHMSSENRFQSKAFLGSMWNTMLAEIAAARKLDVSELNKIADDLSVKFPSEALGKFVDSNGYEDEVFELIKKKTGMAATDKLKFVDISKYHGKPAEVKPTAEKVAVIYANGSINSGEGSEDEIGSAALARTIREARLDDKIKAIVLRVNSPGGSAIASEVIWREMMLAGKAKPTAVSMGDVAASGGYYISCAAHRIFAQPNTITGSIGVFGIVPNFGNMMKEKLGVTFDTVNTNRHSDAGSGVRRLTADEDAYVQSLIERIYATFTQRVAEGRKMKVADVDSIGQGRVWSGKDAMAKNLVDELGGLDDAVAWVVKKAGLKEHRVVEMPRQKNPIEAIFGGKESDAAEMLLKKNLGESYAWLKQAQTIANMKGVQARMPFEVEIK